MCTLPKGLWYLLQVENLQGSLARASEDVQALAAREAALAAELQSLQVVPAWQGTTPR